MYTKTINPHFENDGRRKLLTGFDGALTDESGIVLHSMEYPSYSQAERALDALTHELLVDAAERGMVDTLPSCDPPGDNPLGEEEGDTCPDEYRTTPLLVDVAHVLGMVLGNGHVSDVIPELRRVNARVQAALAEQEATADQIVAHMAHVYLPNWQPALIAADDLPY